MDENLAQKIDRLLPQTQCTKCGYSGCMPYAQAIAKGDADINQCPPGGVAGIKKLAALLNVKEKPLDKKFGIEKPRKIAFIIEEDCIGCTKCLPACPVDAILGANKQMHTILSVECTGCELCIDPCPVDCITMQAPGNSLSWNQLSIDHARQRYEDKQQRLDKQKKQKIERQKKQKQLLVKLMAKK